MSLLQNDRCVEEIRKEILRSKSATIKYSPCARWDKIKSRLRTCCQRLSREAADQKALVIAQLSEVLSWYEDHFPLTEQEMLTYSRTKEDIEVLLEDKIRGIMLRSKVRWFAEGEKNTKYFLALERAAHNFKTCQSLIQDNGVLVENQEDIIEMQRKFYEDLYKKDPTISFQLKNNTGVQLNESEHKSTQQED